MGIALGAPAYVQNICPEKGCIYITTNEKDLFSKGFFMDSLHFPNEESFPERIQGFSAMVKIRYRSRECSCKVLPHPEGCVCIFDTPQRAVTPGQLAVFYEGEKVIASGTISRKKIPE